MAGVETAFHAACCDRFHHRPGQRSRAYSLTAELPLVIDDCSIQKVMHSRPLQGILWHQQAPPKSATQKRIAGPKSSIKSIETRIVVLVQS